MILQNTKTTKGGKRKGAGRKPLAPDQRAVGVTVRVRPAIAASFSAWCTLSGVSQSRVFSQFVKFLARESPNGL
jgi:hypothetical protein